MKTSNIDWATDPIQPRQGFDRVVDVADVMPDFLEIAQNAISKSGRSQAEVSMVDAISWLLTTYDRIVLGMLSSNAQKFPGAMEDMDQILARADYQPELVWNYLTHWEFPGLALRRMVSEHLADLDTWLAEHLANGEFLKS